MLNFDPVTELHLDFVVAAANLLAAVHGIEGSRDREAIGSLVSGVKVEAFKAKEGVKIAANDSEAQSMAQSESTGNFKDFFDREQFLRVVCTSLTQPFIRVQ